MDPRDKVDRWRALGLDPARIVIEPLAPSRHDRAAFTCGEHSLDDYIKTKVSQDLKRGLARCFVLVPEASNERILGYYTISSHVIDLAELDERSRKKMAAYPTLPAILLGRLAIDSTVQGLRLGWLLMMHALRTCLEVSFKAGIVSVVVDALPAAASFYVSLGFTPINDDPLRLHLPIKTVEMLFPTYTAQLRDQSQIPTNPFATLPEPTF